MDRYVASEGATRWTARSRIAVGVSTSAFGQHGVRAAFRQGHVGDVVRTECGKVEGGVPLPVRRIQVQDSGHHGPDYPAGFTAPPDSDVDGHPASAVPRSGADPPPQQFPNPLRIALCDGIQESSAAMLAASGSLPRNLDVTRRREDIDGFAKPN